MAQMIHTIQFKNWVDEVLTEELGKEIASEGITKLEIMYEECTAISPFKNNNMEETLEEAAEMHLNKDGFSVYNHYDTRPSFIEGAKWQQERMYSEEEVLKLLINFSDDRTFLKEDVAIQWFEQFKKQ